jgi:hypothetical protein
MESLDRFRKGKTESHRTTKWEVRRISRCEISPERSARFVGSSIRAQILPMEAWQLETLVHAIESNRYQISVFAV